MSFSCVRPVMRWYLMPVNFRMPSGGEIGPDVLDGQVHADVAVEIAVRRVARVALLGAPDLARGIAVAGKGGDAARA